MREGHRENDRSSDVRNFVKASQIREIWLKKLIDLATLPLGAIIGIINNFIRARRQ
jgi:hypothetical protein